MTGASVVPVVFHVGLSKTGTTTLQQHVFPRWVDCELVTRSGLSGSSTFTLLSANLRLADDGDYLGDTLAAYLAERASAGARTLLVSDEGFAGSHWLGRVDAHRVADRLRRLAPTARVLLCVRSQDARLRSLYSLYVQKGGYEDFEGFLDHASPAHTLDLDNFAYDALVDAYLERFGEANVKVLAYEQFVRDPDRFLDDVASFVGTSERSAVRADQLPVHNRSLSNRSQSVLRASNRWFRRSAYNARPVVTDLAASRTLGRRLRGLDRKLWRGARSTGSDVERRRLDALMPRYEASNARLAKLTGLPLAELGYPMPATAGAEPSRSGR